MSTQGRTPETAQRIPKEDVDPVASPPYVPEIKLVEQPAKIRSCTVYGLVSDETDQPRVSVKVVIEAYFGLDPKQPQSYLSLPVTSKVAESLIQESARLHEGKNTTTLALRRSFPEARYCFHSHGELVEFAGSAAGNPTVKIMKEEVVMTWTVTAQVAKTTFSGLWQIVNSPAVILTVDQYQAGLFDQQTLQ